MNIYKMNILRINNLSRYGALLMVNMFLLQSNCMAINFGSGRSRFSLDSKFFTTKVKTFLALFLDFADALGIVAQIIIGIMTVYAIIKYLLSDETNIMAALKKYKKPAIAAVFISSTDIILRIFGVYHVCAPKLGG